MLADDIRDAIGTQVDFADCLKLVVNSISTAQRFVISDDVVEAANQLLQSKPSSLVSALPLCRLPYDSMWLEWNGEHPVGANPELGLRPGSHKVKRMGCWIAGGDKGRMGAAFWAWQDTAGEVAFGGIGTAFAFENNVDGVYRLFNVPVPDSSVEDIIRMGPSKKHPWSKAWQKNIAEAEAMLQLSRQTAPYPCPWITPFFEMLHKRGITPDDPRVAKIREGWQHDISGEIPFVFALLMLLNTKNAVEHRTTDLTRLNKARAKSSKPPKFDYSVTRLSLSRGQARSGMARGLNAEAMRKHLVRGHFKIRHSGVYWWSSFVRGTKSPVDRHHYDLKE